MGPRLPARGMQTMTHLPYPRRQDYTIPLMILLDQAPDKRLTFTDTDIADLNMDRAITTVYDAYTRQTTIFLEDRPPLEPAPAPQHTPTTTATGKTHDYRIQGWGHSFTFYPEHGEPDRFHALIHNQHNPKEGDRVIWRTPYGEAEATITKVKCLRDPADMYSIYGTIIDRRAIQMERLDG